MSLSTLQDQKAMRKIRSVSAHLCVERHPLVRAVSNTKVLIDDAEKSVYWRFIMRMKSTNAAALPGTLSTGLCAAVVEESRAGLWSE